MLRDKVASGVMWSLAEKVGSMLLQVAVSIIVARLLAPEDFGVMAIMTFFTALALVVVDSGFSQTLIRKVAPTAEEYKSVFVVNVIASLILYALLTLVAPLLANFYEQESITRIAPILFLLLPINALCVIQNTIYTHEFRFDRLSKINFTASLVAGIVAIAVAVFGGGVWALVAQRLSMMAVKAILLWIGGNWRAQGRFSATAIRQMAPFSLRLMATDIISATYNNIAGLFIGKMYSTDTLGYFNQAQKLKDLPLTSAVQSVQSVTYPALSNIKDNRPKFADSYRKVLLVTAFIMFPAMVGMGAVAEDMFLLLLGAKWTPTVPYFRIIVLCGLFYPIAMIAYNVLKVASNGSVIIRLEILKKIIMTAIFALTIPHSVMAIAWGLVAMTAIEAIINVVTSTHYADISLCKIARALLPTTILSVAMYTAVRLSLPYLSDLHLVARLIIEIAIGAGVYIFGALIFRFEALSELKTIFQRLINRAD